MVTPMREIADTMQHWLDLPERVTCLSLYQPFAGLCAAIPPGSPPGTVGLKSLETRTKPFPKARPFPHPLVLCAGMDRDEEAYARIFPKVPKWARPLLDVRGVALVLVEIVGCRLLTAEDEPRSWYWDAAEATVGIERWAWEIGRADPLYPFEVKGRMGFGQTVAREQVWAALSHASRERRAAP